PSHYHLFYENKKLEIPTAAAPAATITAHPAPHHHPSTAGGCRGLEPRELIRQRKQEKAFPDLTLRLYDLRLARLLAKAVVVDEQAMYLYRWDYLFIYPTAFQDCVDQGDGLGPDPAVVARADRIDVVVTKRKYFAEVLPGPLAELPVGCLGIVQPGIGSGA